ncbi:SpoIIE family protein phosphatase [Actinacidiphila glaucinigra]|uniref:SpoIIE family protein phosphatase n=1 Tax=Actinacidiphila glaucinigra TaxID=235986 RepID=UPI00366F901D
MDDRTTPDAEAARPDSRARERAGILDRDLMVALHTTVHQAAHQLHAVAAAVYLLTPDGRELRAALIGGSPPSVLTLPGRMGLDSSYASARALAEHQVAFLAEPDPFADPEHGALAYPYTVASVPLESEGQRFGSLSVLRTENRGGYSYADCNALAQIGDRLVDLLSDLHARGVAIAPGNLPVLIPLFGTEPPAEDRDQVVWGVPDLPGSSGMSLLYALQRLTDMLNRATTMEHVIGVAEFCIVAPSGARALALASAIEGRMWVLGHSGASAGLVRELHGSPVHSGSSAARALLGRPLFVSGALGPSRETSSRFRPGVYEGASGVERQGQPEAAAAYLPLVGSRHVVDLPMADAAPVVGVCCLSFDGPRTFPPEERAVLSMMAGRLGSAVQRIEVSTGREALAESMQKRLLPAVLAEAPRLTTTARYRSAQTPGEVGGDWYDVLVMPDDRVLLVLGDVEGHTLESAAVMGQLRTAVAAYATEGHGPAALLGRTDRLLSRLGTELLTTCCLLAVDTSTGTVEVALAGHPAPLARLPDGTVRRLWAPANVPLGLHVSEPYRFREHTLPPGTVLVLYSDGVHERDNDDVRERLGRDSQPPGIDLEYLADRLLESMPRRRDDAALLLARYEGAEDGTAPRVAQLHVHRRDLSGVKEARGFVYECLCDWCLVDLADDLMLITSELVTNALIHAGSDVDLRLRAFDDHVRLEVRDSDSDPPVPTAYSLTEEGSAQAEHGRGLYLVDALARSWNTSPSGRGKTVWLEMDIPRPA